MTPEQIRQINFEIQDTIVRQVRHLDKGEFEAFANYFTEDAVWTRMGRTSNSRQEILESTKKRSPTVVIRHVFTNFVIDIIDENQATCSCYLSGARTDLGKPPTLPVPFTSRTIAQYEDELVRTSEGWKVSKRDLIPIFIEGDPRLKANQ